MKETSLTLRFGMTFDVSKRQPCLPLQELPASQLGDHKSSLDPRSCSLPAVLSATDTFEQSQIANFASTTGCKVSQFAQHLDCMWPCRRSRWWCLISAPFLEDFDLQPPLKMFEVTRLEQLISHITPWLLMMTVVNIKLITIISLCNEYREDATDGDRHALCSGLTAAVIMRMKILL